MAVKPRENGNDLDQIRQLIVGKDLETIDEKFASLSKEFEQLRKKLSQFSAEVDGKFTSLESAAQDNSTILQKNLQQSFEELKQELETVKNGLSARVDALVREKPDRVRLADYLIEAGNRLKNE